MIDYRCPDCGATMSTLRSPAPACVRCGGTLAAVRGDAPPPSPRKAARTARKR